MELGRDGQISDLMDNGWYIDDDCQSRQMADRTMGGPTYMKSPDGILHEVGYGTTKPVTS